MHSTQSVRIDVIAYILLSNMKRNGLGPNKKKRKEEKEGKNHYKEIHTHLFSNVSAFFGVQAKWAY